MDDKSHSVSSRKILYVIGSLDLGGAERHVCLISSRLNQLGWEPIIYCITRRGIQSQGLEKSGVKIIGPPWEFAPGQTAAGKFIRLMASCIRLFGLMLFQRPQIVHFFLPLAYLMGAPLALLARAPVLVMSRRSLNNYQIQHPILRRLELWLHPRMNAILGNSKAVVEQLINVEKCERDKVHLIYNGIDIERIDRAPPARAKTIASQGAVAMITVANLIPYKGHRDLIEALGNIHEKLPNKWRLTCVGRDQGIREDLENKARQLGIQGHIHFAGERTDVASLLKQSDIGLLCSHEEGFSNAILEGMAAELAMIVTDVGGNGEAVVDGITGLVTRPRDPQSLANAILALVQNPELRASMARAGRKRVEERFALPECVKGYDELYRGLLRG